MPGWGRIERMFDLTVAREQLEGLLAQARATGGAAPLADWVDLVGGCQQLVSVTQAVQAVAVAHVAGFEEVQAEDGTLLEEFRGVGHRRLDAPALVAEGLGLGAAVASGRVESAVDLVSRHPQLVAVMGQGRLDAYRAGVVAEELTGADDEVAAQVVAEVEPWLGREPAGPLRRRVRRAVAAVDAELVRSRAERARGERLLRRHASTPGVDEWSARLPVEQARSAWSVIDTVARRYLKDGRCTGIDQARADALLDLVHARATGAITVQLAVPASQLTAAVVDAARTTTGAGGPAHEDGEHGGDRGHGRADDGLVPASGFGLPGVTYVSRSWLAALTGAAPSGSRRNAFGQAASGSRAADGAPGTMSAGTADSLTQSNSAQEADAPAVTCPATVVVVACDDTTGALVPDPCRPSGADPARRCSPSDADPARPASPGRHRPPEWMVRFVRARDGSCRFPGCSVNARFCDVDHVIAWPVGETVVGNLACLCRRHHRVKQRPGWRVRLHADASMTWTDPLGREHTTVPQDLLQVDHPRASSPSSSEEQRGATGADDVTQQSPAPRQPGVVQRGEAEAPSALEELLGIDIDTAEMHLACREENLTAHGRRALRLNRTVNVSRWLAQDERDRHSGLRPPLDLHQPPCAARVTGLRCCHTPGGSPAARRTPPLASRPSEDVPPPF